MSENDANTAVKRPVRLRLNSIKNVGRTLARLLREYHADPKADSRRFRDLVYGCKALGETMKLEIDVNAVADLQARLAKIEDDLKKGKHL